MKTKNNTQKTVLKSLAVITSLVLISFTAIARDLQKPCIENETFNETILAIDDKGIKSRPASTTFTDVSSFANYLKTESENTLALEEWMTNEQLFNVHENTSRKKTIKTATFYYEEIEESKLKFEAWMFHLKYWRVKK